MTFRSLAFCRITQFTHTKTMNVFKEVLMKGIYVKVKNKKEMSSIWAKKKILGFFVVVIV